MLLTRSVNNEIAIQSMEAFIVIRRHNEMNDRQSDCLQDLGISNPIPLIGLTQVLKEKVIKAYRKKFNIVHFNYFSF